MMFKGLTVMLLVDDVDAAQAWYQDMLGAALQNRLPVDPSFEWGSI